MQKTFTSGKIRFACKNSKEKKLKKHKEKMLKLIRGTSISATLVQVYLITVHHWDLVSVRLLKSKH